MCLQPGLMLVLSHTFYSWLLSDCRTLQTPCSCLNKMFLHVQPGVAEQFIRA
jgi:hypothetical protein